MFNEALVWAYYDDAQDNECAAPTSGHQTGMHGKFTVTTNLVAWYFSQFNQGMDLIYQYQPHPYGITRKFHQGLDNRLLTYMHVLKY